jgi:exonuclease SbcC
VIEYIRIENFQSHVDSIIRFSSGITAITGLSMSGKTAVKRAFEWVRKNRPTGFRFNYRYHDKPTRVEIGVDGHVITLEKSTKAIDEEGSKAVYRLLYPDGYERTFTSFGTSVPEEVTELLGISDISIQDQLDAYLLVISSAGEIARTMNRITGIDIGDQWIREISQVITSANKRKSAAEGSIAFNSQDVKRYDGIDNLKEKIEQAIIDQDQYEVDVKVYNNMIDIINKYLEASEWVKSNKSKITPLQSMLDSYEKEKSDIAELKKKRERINEAMLLGEAVNEIRSALDFLSPKLQDFEDYVAIKGERERIQSTISDYQSQKESWQRISNSLEAKKRELADFLVSVGVCWVCGGEICDHEKIMESL